MNRPGWWLPIAAALVGFDYATGPYYQFPAVYILPGDTGQGALVATDLGLDPAGVLLSWQYQSAGFQLPVAGATDASGMPLAATSWRGWWRATC